MDMIALSSTIVISPCKAIEFGEKRKIRLLRCSRSFKVIEVGTNRKTVCDFLLAINSK